MGPTGLGTQRGKPPSWADPGQSETGHLIKLLLSWGLTPKSNNKTLPVHSGLLELPRYDVFLKGRKALLALLASSAVLQIAQSLWAL